MTPPLNPPGYPQDGSYADLLLWHLYVWGTRPGGSTTTRADFFWVKAKFIDAVFKGQNTTRPDKPYDSWVGKGRRSAPDNRYAPRIAQELFNDEPQFATWAKELDKARERSLGEGQNVATINIAEAISALAALEAPNVPASSSIPRLTPYFMGRQAEVGAIVAMLAEDADSAAILVQGGPGIGKTELTKAVAHHDDVARRFGDRRWFVSLESATTAEGMKDTIVRTLGCDPQDGFKAVLDMLRGAPALLVLDNLETPWEPLDERLATEATLAELVAVQGVSIIASFRGREAVGDIRWADYTLDELALSAATELFGSLAGEWVARDPYLHSFIRALGAIPLAIDLVARRAHGRNNLLPLWQEWLRIGSDLAKRPDFDETCSTSLPYSIALSLGSPRLKRRPHAARLFSLLGHMPSGLDTSDIATLIGEENGFQAIESLCHVGLAVERSGRVNLLPPIREYAVRHTLCEPSHLKQAEDNFCALLIEVEREDGRYRTPSLWKRVVANAANIEACLAAKLEMPVSNGLETACNTIIEMFNKRLISDSLMEKLSDYLKSVGAFERQGAVLLSIAQTNLFCHNRDKARQAAVEALQIYLMIRDEANEAQCRESLGRIELEDGQYNKAYFQLTTALSLCDVGRPMLRASCLKGLGLIALKRNRPEEADKLFMSAMSICERADSQYGMLLCYMCLGQAWLDRSNLDAAHLSYTKALEIRIDNRMFVGMDVCLEALASVAERRGDAKLALAALGHALDAMKASYNLDEIYLSSLNDTVLTPARRVAGPAPS